MLKCITHQNANICNSSKKTHQRKKYLSNTNRLSFQKILFMIRPIEASQNWETCWTLAPCNSSWTPLIQHWEGLSTMAVNQRHSLFKSIITFLDNYDAPSPHPFLSASSTDSFTQQSSWLVHQLLAGLRVQDVHHTDQSIITDLASKRMADLYSALWMVVKVIKQEIAKGIRTWRSSLDNEGDGLEASMLQSYKDEWSGEAEET